MRKPDICDIATDNFHHFAPKKPEFVGDTAKSICACGLVVSNDYRKIYEAGVREYLDSKLSEHIRPPLGLMPKFIWQEHRLEAIKEAIERHLDDGTHVIPNEWITEYNQLISDLESRKKSL